METVRRYYRVAGKDLVYLKFILEAYEGLCTMSTVDGKGGIVQVDAPLPFADDVAALLEAVAAEIPLTEVDWGGNGAG